MTLLAGKGIESGAVEASTEKDIFNQKAGRQKDIRSALGLPIADPTSSPNPADEELQQMIKTSGLTPYRQRVLLALMQVPPSRFTTYAALAGFLDSSPRAVGNALRNNPFAPRVPCHRVVAADLGIGGFGGSWGMTGEHVGEKIRLLRQEGVKVSSERGKVMGAIWDKFIPQ